MTDTGPCSCGAAEVCTVTIHRDPGHPDDQRSTTPANPDARPDPAAIGDCGKHTLSGDLECRLRADHTGAHAGGFPRVEWHDTLEDDGKQPRTELGPWLITPPDPTALLVAERDELQGRLDDALEDRDDWRARAGVLEDDRDALEAKLGLALLDLGRARTLAAEAQEAAGRFADHADKAQARSAELATKLERVLGLTERAVAAMLADRADKGTPGDDLVDAEVRDLDTDADKAERHGKPDGCRPGDGCPCYPDPECGLMWSVGVTRSVIVACRVIGPHDTHLDGRGHHITDADARRLGFRA